MMEKNDEDASLYQTMMGTDPGDDPVAPAGGAASNAAASVASTVRSRTVMLQSEAA